MTTPTSYETRARERKAVALSETLRLCGVTAADAALLDQPMRDQLARTAGFNSPSELTWQLVLGLLVQAEATANTDPFAGLPGGTR